MKTTGSVHPLVQQKYFPVQHEDWGRFWFHTCRFYPLLPPFCCFLQFVEIEAGVFLFRIFCLTCISYSIYSIFSKFFVHEIVVSKTVVTRVNVKSLQCLIDYDIGVANIFEGNCTGNMKVIALTSSIKFCFGILTANYVVEWLISLWVCKVLLYGSFFTTTCVAHSSNKLVSIYLF